MIKCNVTACGTISSSAEEKQSKDGEKFISFGMAVNTLVISCAFIPNAKTQINNVTITRLII